MKKMLYRKQKQTKVDHLIHEYFMKSVCSSLFTRVQCNRDNKTSIMQCSNSPRKREHLNMLTPVIIYIEEARIYSSVDRYNFFETFLDLDIFILKGRPSL